MNLSKEEREELNNLLSDRKIKLPDFRRVVNASGGNYHWLQQNLAKFNGEVLAQSSRLQQLLNLKP